MRTAKIINIDAQAIPSGVGQRHIGCHLDDKPSTPHKAGVKKLLPLHIRDNSVLATDTHNDTQNSVIVVKISNL